MADALPLWWATALSVALFVGIAIVVTRIPRDNVYADAPDRSSWRDLRWWAIALVIVQVLIYLVFV